MPASPGHTTIVNDFFKSIHDGTHQNIMYFYEKSRNIVVVYTYNYLTGKGEYTACIWHHVQGQPGGVSWNRKKHRHTATERFVKCPRIPFEFVFNQGDRFFFPNLQDKIRRTIHIQGVKGVSQNVSKDGMSVVPSRTATHSLKEYSSPNAINASATNSVVNVIN